MPRTIGALILIAALALPGCTARKSSETLTAPPQAEPVDSSPVDSSPVDSSPAGRAVALYDEGRYDEAKPLLETLEAEGKLTGPLLYRLGYVQGSGPRQNELMQRALSELEKEAASANNLEVSFFRANALSNLGRPGDARIVAVDATNRVEQGEWPKPVKPVEHFRLAKLYQDQGKNGAAAAEYRAALAGWDAKGVKTPGYERWARRFLAQDATNRGDAAEVDVQLGKLVALGEATAQDYDRLAVARVRARNWAGAAEAWREAEKLDPASADRPRYARHLARLAEGADDVPAQAPSGSAWSALTQQELETLLAEKAKLVREARAEAAQGATAERKAELQAELSRAKGVFAAAGLEYVVRYLDIRQTAFTSGYAPLIFHPGEWTVEVEQQPAS
jgi:hypothetical protein